MRSTSTQNRLRRQNDWSSRANGSASRLIPEWGGTPSLRRPLTVAPCMVYSRLTPKESRILRLHVHIYSLRWRLLHFCFVFLNILAACDVVFDTLRYEIYETVAKRGSGLPREGNFCTLSPQASRLCTKQVSKELKVGVYWATAPNGSLAYQRREFPDQSTNWLTGQGGNNTKPHAAFARPQRGG